MKLLTCFAALLALAAASYQWVDYQNIPAHGANDWEFFEINGNSYLAVAGFVSSEIYLWNAKTALFEPFQSINSGAVCLGVTSFTIDSDMYIVVATYTGSTSEVYKFNTKANQFKSYQSITVSDPRKWKFATIDGGSYIATTDNSGFSSVYQWDDTSAQFVFFQHLAIANPQDLCFYNIGSQSFLAVANGGNAPATVYMWNGTAFDFVQTLPALQGSDITAFEIDSTSYLAVASLSPHVTHIFRWDATFSQYASTQNLSSLYEDFSVTAYTIGTQPYLAVATVGKVPSFRGKSQIFEWNSAQDEFVLYQEIPTLYTEKITYFEISGESYIAAAYATGNYTVYTLDSQVFKWVDTK